MELIGIDYVRGWVDRQSQVNVAGRSIVATAVSDYPIRAVAACLKREGIDCILSLRRGVQKKRRNGDLYEADQWELRIGRREALQQWKDTVGFLNRGKARLLDEILSSYVM